MARASSLAMSFDRLDGLKAVPLSLVLSLVSVQLILLIVGVISPILAEIGSLRH